MLDRKIELKMLEFSSFLKLNKIHMVDSSFNEDSKNKFFFPGRPYFRGRDGRKI